MATFGQPSGLLGPVSLSVALVSRLESPPTSFNLCGVWASGGGKSLWVRPPGSEYNSQEGDGQACPSENAARGQGPLGCTEPPEGAEGHGDGGGLSP